VSETYDVLGIGFGPANIALAAAVREEAPGLNCRFLEARPASEWQPGMLLPGTDIQNNPIRDLATLRNPKSEYSFINYLFSEGRLLHYLNLPLHFPPRLEYARYVRWAADKFSDIVDYDAEVTGVSLAPPGPPGYLVTASNGQLYQAKMVVLGVGRPPYIPEPFGPEIGSRVFHSADYVGHKRALLRSGALRDVAVIGSSQSAAEITQDLHASQPDVRVHCVMRGFGYRLKDTSPFSEEAFFPEFTDYYYHADRPAKASLDRQLRGTNYSCADRDVIDQLYVCRYEDGLLGEQRLILYNNREVEAVAQEPGGVTLQLREQHTGARRRLTVDAVVLATGFRDLGPAERDERVPRLLAPISAHLPTGDDGVIVVERDYAVPVRGTGWAAPPGPIFLNGLCENTHGLGDAGSFSLLALRARTILDGVRSRLGTGSTPAARPWTGGRVDDRLRTVFPRRIVLLSPPRTGSTPVARLLWNHSGISHHCHEPFEARYWGNGVDEAARIFGAPLQLHSGRRVPLDTLGRAPGLLIKDMTFQVDHDAFEALSELATHPFVFVMRPPRPATVSRLHIVRELSGSSTFPPFESGWESLREQIARCRKQAIDYVLVDSDDLRQAPAQTARRLCASLGLPLEPGLTDWSPRQDLKLCAPGIGALMSPIRERDDPFYRRVLGSDGVQPMDDRDDAADLELIRAAGLLAELAEWTGIYQELRDDKNLLKVGHENA
jgi:L-ornithine N5-monooxygenase